MLEVIDSCGQWYDPYVQGAWYAVDERVVALGMLEVE